MHEANLVVLACSAMHKSLQTNLEFKVKVQPLEPKNARDARASAQKGKWLLADEIKLKTVWKMGTFEIVDLQLGIIPLQRRFTYKIQQEQDCQIGKFKAREVVKGDMQTEDE